MNAEERKILLQQYEEQKNIEKYQMKRVLPLPGTTKAMMVWWSILLIMICGAVVAFGVSLLKVYWVRVSAIAIVLIVIMETYGRFMGRKAVECYQHYAPEERRRRCLCVPSCSEYAILCFRKFGLVKALLKIRKRLFVTCRGSDYKIDWP